MPVIDVSTSPVRRRLSQLFGHGGKAESSRRIPFTEIYQNISRCLYLLVCLALTKQPEAIINHLFYRAVSISLVFINKALLPSGKDDSKSLDAPLFVTWFQCVVTVIICYLLSFGAKVFPQLGKFPDLELNHETMIKVLLLNSKHLQMMIFDFSGASIVNCFCSHDFVQ